MKTKNILITLTILLSTVLKAQTKSTSVSYPATDGIVNSLNKFIDDDFSEKVGDVKEKSDGILNEIKDVFEGINFWEKFMQNDIRLKMIVKNENKGRTRLDDGVKDGGGSGFYAYNIGDDELYVEFDWDNRALSMIGNSSKTEYYNGTKTMGGSKLFEVGGKDKIVQYTDKDGNWYSPVEDMEGYEHVKYIKFNAKQMAVDMLNSWLDLSIELNTNKLVSELLGIASTIDIENPVMNFAAEGPIYGLLVTMIDPNIGFEHYETRGDAAQIELQNKLNEAIKALLNKKLEEIGGLPIFIHWAFIYTPETIRQHYGSMVKETPFECDGVANACTKFTVLQGEDSGKSMEFDSYDRLKFINAKKDGTANFFYDKDITVTLPDPSEVMSLSNIMGDLLKGGDEKRTEQEIQKDYKEIIEKLRREDAKKEEILEYIKKEIRELEVKRERAITKKERDKIQQILDEVNEILENETNN